VIVLVGPLICALVLALAGFVVQLGDASLSRARAQLAADAAALAAAAEAAPFGGSDQHGAARRFAEANGAQLSDCDCEPGASSVQVEVRVDDVIARARAVVDARLFGPLLGAGATGLDPRMATALHRLIEAAGGRVHIVSGWRSFEQQTELWEEALIEYGSAEAARRWVAPPGTSMHEKGLAADLEGDTEYAAALASRLGLPLYRPLAHEEWHFELLGSRG
jgi:hypothetical protein